MPKLLGVLMLVLAACGSKNANPSQAISAGDSCTSATGRDFYSDTCGNDSTAQGGYDAGLQCCSQASQCSTDNNGNTTCSGTCGTNCCPTLYFGASCTTADTCCDYNATCQQDLAGDTTCCVSEGTSPGDVLGEAGSPSNANDCCSGTTNTDGVCCTPAGSPPPGGNAGLCCDPSVLDGSGNCLTCTEDQITNGTCM